jgi:hypothetical protein
VGHDPRAASWRQRGGQHTSAAHRADKRLPLRLRDVADVLRRALRATEDGSMPPNVATALAALARALVAVQQAGELEAAVAALEQRAADVARFNGTRYTAPPRLTDSAPVLHGWQPMEGGDTWPG